MKDLDGLFPAELRDRLIALRRELHRHPELSLKEERTAQRLHDELALLKPATLKRVAGTGVVARFKGRDPKAPVIAVRGDIDALPIQEECGGFRVQRPRFLFGHPGSLRLQARPHRHRIEGNGAFRLRSFFQVEHRDPRLQ